MNLQRMQHASHDAANLLRSLANEKRLLIVCQLAHGKQTVGAISAALDLRQSTVSQELSRLRREGIVTPARDAQMVYYSLSSEDVRSVVELLYDRFCSRPRLR